MTKNVKKKKLDLKIKDLTKQSGDKLTIHEDLPSLPTIMNLVGCSGVGKTNVIINLLTHFKKFIKGNIVLFTKSLDDTYIHYEHPLGIHIYYDDEDVELRIKKILTAQRENKETFGHCPHVVILFDDFVTDQLLNKRRSPIYKLYTYGRHLNISTLMSSQSWTLIPSNLRRLAWYDIIFDISNRKEKKSMIEELCGSLKMTEEEFEQAYNSCVDERFAFLYINRKKKTYSKNFGV